MYRSPRGSRHASPLRRQHLRRSLRAIAANSGPAMLDHDLVPAASTLLRQPDEQAPTLTPDDRRCAQRHAPHRHSLAAPAIGRAGSRRRHRLHGVAGRHVAGSAGATAGARPEAPQTPSWRSGPERLTSPHSDYPPKCYTRSRTLPPARRPKGMTVAAALLELLQRAGRRARGDLVEQTQQRYDSGSRRRARRAA